MSRRRNKLQKVVNSSRMGFPRGQRRSASPNLLPGSIVANGSQEDMNTDEDSQGNKREQANGQEKHIQDLRVATGDCQHGGLSLSAPRTLAKHHQQRLRRGRETHPKKPEKGASRA